MKLRVALIVLALLCLGAYAVTNIGPPTPSPNAQIVSPATTPPSETSALSGVWEGMDPGGFPARLIVEQVHERWATVLYTWGDDPDGQFERGWMRVRAKVLADGRLLCRYPGNFSFQLSEDRTTLAGKREQADRSADFLMRRLPAEAALNRLNSSSN